MGFVPSTYTVESVTKGHPDKVCDQISDAILFACLREDPSSRVAVETFGGHGLLVIGGEVTTRARVDYAAVARTVYQSVGYDDPLEVIVRVVEQSPDIKQGVDVGGAGDQGIMYGFATDETPELLPRGVVLARALTRRLEEARERGEIAWLGPDGKAQVTIAAGGVTTVLVSTQHAAHVGQEEIRAAVSEKIVRAVDAFDGAEVLVNPTGRFVLGGFAADTGLTGRKIMVDTYGGIIPHGGGAFSGKDLSKVDRSGALVARNAAKELVRAGHARECLVSAAYAIGKAEPVMLCAVNERGEDLSRLLRVDRFLPRNMAREIDLASWTW